MATYSKLLRELDSGIRLEHIVPPTEESSHGGVPNRLTTSTQQIQIKIDDEYLPTYIVFDPIDDTAISPLQIQIERESTDPKEGHVERNIDLTIHTENRSPVEFYMFVTPRSSEQSRRSIEIHSPSLRALNWTTELLNGDYHVDILEHMSGYYEDHPVGSIRAHLKNLGTYLSSDQFLRLLNIFAKIDPEFRDSIAEIYSPSRIAQYLPGGMYDSHLDIDSWTRLRQFCSTSSKLRYTPTFDESDIAEAAISLSFEPIDNQQVETNLERFWTLEKRLDITEQYPEQLNELQLIGLVSKAADERRYDRIRDIVEQKTQPSSIDDLDAAIERAKDPTSNQNWRGQQTFECILANFLKESAENTSTSIMHTSFIYRAAANLYEKLGIADSSRTARFWEHYLRGQRALDIGEFGSAKRDYARARKLCLQEIQEIQDWGEVRQTNLAGSWVHLCEARMNHHIEEGNYQTAIKELSDSIQAVDVFQDFSTPASQTYCLTRIKALRHEAEGDKFLSNHQYTKAKKAYGKAVGKLLEVDEDLEGDIHYLKDRRSAIAASVFESDGKYDKAAGKYKEIRDRAETKNSFVKFNQSRRQLCLAKDALVEGEFSEAEILLDEIEYRGGTLSEEIEHINFLLELLEDYQAGQTTEASRVWKTLSEATEIETDDAEISIGYGHDYRPALIHILAAQRWKNITDSEEMLDSLVEIAMNDVLKPTNLDSIIAREGFKQMQPIAQWKENVPDFIVQQHQDVEKETLTKRSSDNYKSQLKNLTGILEECIEVLIAYYARKEYGDLVRANRSGRERLSPGPQSVS